MTEEEKKEPEVKVYVQPTSEQKGLNRKICPGYKGRPNPRGTRLVSKFERRTMPHAFDSAARREKRND